MFLVILLVGLFLRIYKFDQYFMYSHDQDLASWVIKDITVNGHHRLIGQETSTKGVFIGSLFYYSLIPFYWASNWDPIGGIFLSIFISLASMFSIYFVFTKIFNKKVGLIGALVYSISYLVVFTDREVVPTTPVMLWSIWFLYALHLILRAKQRSGFLLSTILGGLIWQINLSLLLLTPLIPLSFILSKKRLDYRALALGFVMLIISSSPFLLFEVKHDFQQINAIYESLVTDNAHIQNTTQGLYKWDRTMQLVYKNTTNLFVGDLLSNQMVMLWVLIISSFFLWRKKIIPNNWSILILIWVMLFITFFSLNSINLSEYYLNGKNIIWILIFSLGVSYLLQKPRFHFMGLTILLLFISINLIRFFQFPQNNSGYLYRKKIVQFIKDDAKVNKYPCVSISYIVSPGNDLGYRYLFYLENLHVNQPKSGSPVYSIVYPHSLVDKLDLTFGALGLVLPDYERYNKDQVTVSCQGQNSNITDPMFGFTQ